MPLSSFIVQNFKKSLKCIWSFEDAISIQIEGIKSPWDIFGLEVVRIFYHFGLQCIRTFWAQKSDKIHKYFELYSVFMSKTVLLSSQNIYYL